jgi:hypothetical protein
MKFAHLLVAAHFAERPEPGSVRRSTSGVAAQEWTGVSRARRGKTETEDRVSVAAHGSGGAVAVQASSRR